MLSARRNTCFLIAIILLINFLSLYMFLRHDASISLAEEKIVQYPLLSADHFEKVKSETYGATYRRIIHETVEIVQFNVSKPLPSFYSKFECILMNKSQTPYNVCLHEKDMISDRVRKNLYYERGVEKLIKNFTDKYPESTFVDLGANLGFHSLYTAVLEKRMKILALEPFPQNVMRIHKAAHLNNVQNQIEVIMAAISDKRGPVIFFELNGSFAENTLFETGDQRYRKGLTTSSIIFDDLIPLIKTKTVFLKIDVEGFECYVFSKAHQFFEQFRIPIVATEIRHTKNQPLCCFESMVKFFRDRNYQPFEDHDENKPLDYANWKNWNSHDIFFREKLIKT